MTSLKKPDLVIWDWDGTLVDTLGVVFQAQNYVREQLLFRPFSYEEFLVVAHQSSRDAFASMYGDRSDEAMSLLTRYMEEKHLKGIVLFDYAKNLLEYISSLRIPMIIVSNKRSRFLNAEVDFFALSGFFKGVVGAGEAEYDKPRAAPVYMALKKAGLEHQDIKHAWFVGDSQPDIDCAKNLPFETCSVIIGENVTVGEECRFKDLQQFNDIVGKSLK